MSEQTVADRLAQAIQCNAAGQLAKAEDLCRQILRSCPDHSVARELLAVILCRGGKFAEGEVLLHQLLAQRPNDPEIIRHLTDVLYEQGKAAQSAEMARRLRDTTPGDATAYLRLGTALQAMGRLDDAVEAYARALLLQDRLPQGYFNLATVLHRMGRLDEAVAAYLRAIQQSPQDATAYLNLGNVLCDQGKYDDALVAYRHALGCRPDWAEALTNAGLAAQKLERLDEAEAAHQRAVEAAPDYGPAWGNLGTTLQRLGRLRDAVVAFEKAATLQPGNSQALSNLAQALDKIGEKERGIENHRRAVAADPTDASAYYNLGVSLHSSGHLEEAQGAYERAVALAPGRAEPYLGLGNLLYDQQRFEAAVAAFRQALSCRPAWPEALTNAGVAVETLEEVSGRRCSSVGLLPDDDAGRHGPDLAATAREGLGTALHRHAICINPDYALAHFNLGVALLRKAEYGEGWKEYGWRWRAAVTKLQPRGFAQPEWDGGDLAGRTLLLHAEQGFGDTIQFVRFVRHAALRGGRIILEVQPALARLLKNVPGADRVIPRGQPLPGFDVHLPLLSLPGVLELPEDSFADDVPYLAPDAGDIVRWRPRLDRPGRRVGLVWSGNPAHRADRQRSLAAAPFLARLSQCPVQLFSLQKDVRASDAAALTAHADVVVDLGAELADFADTAAVMSQLDLLISVDTATAHLAGAVGCPVWLLLPFTADWRWQCLREDSPWYPNMRLFRHTAPGDWTGVVDNVVRALS